MKICFCINQLTKGGAERVVINLANYLCHDNEITIISLLNKKCEYSFDEKIDIIYLDKNKNLNKITKFLFRIKKFNSIIKKVNPDVLLSFLPEASFISLFKKQKSIKYIVSVRNDPIIEYHNVLYKILMKILYPKADGFVFQTKEAKKYFKKSIQEKSEIIYNSVNPKFLVKPYSGKRSNIIVTVGRLNEQKNQLLLLEAFKNFNESKNYKLYIYGEGPERNKLEKYIIENNLKNSVFLPGTKDDIENYIYDAKCFVLSSNYEGMPNALIEALCLGIPCISTNCPCGGPFEIIENEKYGVLIPVNDVEQLTKSLEKVCLDDKYNKLLSSNQSYFHNLFNPKKINDEWLSYIKKVGDSKK